MPLHREIVELGITHVPENRRLFSRMTVEDNLRMGGFIPHAIGQVCTSMCRCSMDVPSLKP
jgi:ABC-type branched-subunit amino acid transport system ATPase component